MFVKKKILLTVLAAFITLSLSGFNGNDRKMNILVYPFEMSGGNKNSWIAAGLTDTVISDLSRIRDIYVFSSADRKKALKEISLGMTGVIKETDIVRIGKVMGANMIFTGSVQTAGNKVRVNAKLVNIETTQIEKSVKLDGTVEGIFDLQDRVVTDLMSSDKKEQNKTAVDNKDEKTAGDKRPAGDVYELYSKGVELYETDLIKALEFFLKALEIDPGYVDALIKAGTVYDELNEFDKSLEYLMNAQEILEKSGRQNTAEYAEMLNSLGLVERDSGDYEKALGYYTKSLKIRESLKLASTVNYSETLSNIGIVYVDTAKYDRALEYFSAAQKILEEIKFQNSSKYAILLNNIGGVYWSKGNNDMALVYYLMSQDIRDKLDLKVTAGYAYLMNNIGGVYWKKGDNEKAILYYVRSQEIRDWLGLNNTESYCVLMNNISLTYYKRLKDPCKGAEYMKKCVEIGQKNNLLRLASDIRDLKEMQEACRTR